MKNKQNCQPKELTLYGGSEWGFGRSACLFEDLLKVHQGSCWVEEYSKRFHELGIRSYVEEIRKEWNLNEGKGKTVGQGQGRMPRWGAHL